jgi:hypothetical protein
MEKNARAGVGYGCCASSQRMYSRGIRERLDWLDGSGPEAYLKGEAQAPAAKI